MSLLHHAATDIERRTDNAIGFEPFEREDRADDVDDRIERANLVQMNLLDGNLMNRRFGDSQTLKEIARAGFTLRRQRRPVNPSVDFRQAVMPMRVAVRGGDSRVAVVTVGV